MKYTVIRREDGGGEEFIGEVECIQPSFLNGNVCGLNISLKWRMRLIIVKNSYKPIKGSLETCILLCCLDNIVLNSFEDKTITLSCEVKETITLTNHKEDWDFSKQIIEMYDRE